jgi:hypothetical protein
MRWSVGAAMVSFLFLSMALLPLPARSQKKREPLVETVSPAAPPAPTGPARGAMVHFVLDRTLKTPVRPIRGRKVAAYRVRRCEKTYNLAQRRKGAETRNRQLLCFVFDLCASASLHEMLLLVDEFFHTFVSYG